MFVPLVLGSCACGSPWITYTHHNTLVLFLLLHHLPHDTPSLSHPPIPPPHTHVSSLNSFPFSLLPPLPTLSSSCPALLHPHPSPASLSCRFPPTSPSFHKLHPSYHPPLPHNYMLALPVSNLVFFHIVSHQRVQKTSKPKKKVVSVLHVSGMAAVPCPGG